jgi:hypothetical protein
MSAPTDTQPFAWFVVPWCEDCETPATTVTFSVVWWCVSDGGSVVNGIGVAVGGGGEEEDTYEE